LGAFTPAELATTVLAVASGIVLIANAAEKIIKAWKGAKAPHVEQNNRIKNLEEWRKEVEKRLDKGSDHFDAIDASNRVTQLALLALLDHGIDGNNIDQMQHAKEELQTHLINR
jgi:hypothetical protein